MRFTVSVHLGGVCDSKNVLGLVVEFVKEFANHLSRKAKTGKNMQERKQERLSDMFDNL